MNWSAWIRTAHRWLGIALIALTLANIVAFSLGQTITWLIYAPLAPLFLLMFSGLYMFVLPYLRKPKSI